MNLNSIERIITQAVIVTQTGLLRRPLARSCGISLLTNKALSRVHLILVGLGYVRAATGEGFERFLPVRNALRSTGICLRRA